MARLVIRQIEAPSTLEEPHTLALTGLAGPVDEIDWGEGTQRAVDDWHAGSGEASTQLLGPEEGEGSFEFVWRGRDIGGTDAATLDGAPLLTVEDILAAAQKLRADRALVVVEWRGAEYLGRMAGVHPRERAESELAVSIRVQWLRPLEYRRPARAVGAQVSEVADAVASEWEGAGAIVPPVTVSRLTGEGIARAIDGVTGDVLRLLSVARDIASSGGIERAAQTLANYTPAARQAQAAGEVLGALRSSALTLADAAGAPVGETAQTDDPGARVETRLYLARSGRASRRVRDVAVVEGARFAALGAGSALAVHDAIAGETLFSLALRYYGDVRGWREISAANELARTTLRAGQRVIIPRRGGARA